MDGQNRSKINLLLHTCTRGWHMLSGFDVDSITANCIISDWSKLLSRNLGDSFFLLSYDVSSGSEITSCNKIHALVLLILLNLLRKSDKMLGKPRI